MSEFILLRLDGEFRPSTWLRCDSVRGPIGFSQAASEPLPPKLKIIAVCAAPTLALRSVSAPKQGRERFRLAIGFALEDFVASDVDELSFVLPLTLDEGAQVVAVINKMLLQQALAALRESGFQLAAMVPLPCLLAPDTVWVERALTSFRFGGSESGRGDSGRPDSGRAEAGTIESESLSAILKIKQSGDGALPLHLLLNDGINFPKLPSHFSAEAIAEPNHYLAARLLQMPQLLSLTTPDKPAGSGFRLSQRWRLAAGLSALALFAQGGRIGADFYQLSNTLSVQEQEIDRLYAQVYPNGPVSLDPVAMLQSKLKSEQTEVTAGARGGALALFRRIAPVLYTETRLALISADYRNGELELSFRSPDLATIDALRARLSTLSGLEVSLGNNNIDPNGQMLTGRIKIKEVGLAVASFQSYFALQTKGFA
jgi:type II secretion system protein L